MNRLFISVPGRSSQSGMTLIEIMVALAISMFLLLGVTQIFIGNKLTYRVQENLSRIQENGRYAVELLNQEIRMANYRGCAGSKAHTKKNLLNCSSTNCSLDVSDLNWNLLGDNPARGFDAQTSGWSPTLDSSLTGVVAGKDVLTVRGPDTTNSGFVISQANNTAALQVNQPAALNLQANDIVMVADCSDIVVFQITGITGTGPINIAHSATGSNPGNSTNDLGKIFTGAEVTRVSTKSYYIGTGASGQPALFRRTPTTNQELVEGVEDMQIVYGVDDNGDGAIDRYINAKQIEDGSTSSDSLWAKVRSLQIRLLLRSLDDKLTPTYQSITYNGSTVIPNDYRLRQVFTTTIGLRNQLD